MVCNAGCHNNCTHCTGEEGCCKPDPYTWSRHNWCCILRVVFAIIGIGVPLYMYLRPCEPKLENVEVFETVYEFYNTSQRRPADIYFVIDGSTSMEQPISRWENQRESTKILMETFRDDVPEVSLGLGIFSDQLQSKFVYDLSDDMSIIDSITELELPGGGTHYEIALQMFQKQFILYGRNQGLNTHNTGATFKSIQANEGCTTDRNVVYNNAFPIRRQTEFVQCEWEIAEDGYLVIHTYGDDVGRVLHLFVNDRMVPFDQKVEKIRMEVKASDKFLYDTAANAERGFIAYMEQPYHVEQGIAKSILVFISDGDPQTSHAFPDKLEDFETNLKLYHDIIGIMVNSDKNAGLELCKTSKCYETTGCMDHRRGTCHKSGDGPCVGEADCLYYVYEPDFDKFREEAKDIAKRVIDSIPIIQNVTREEKTISTIEQQRTCVVAPWLGFLALLIPLLLLLCVGWTVDTKKQVVRRKEKIVKPVQKAPPPAPVMVKKPKPAPKRSIVNVEGKEGGKRYKWEIPSADQYLWSSAGGTAPMKVDWAGKAPPSAPLDHTKEKKKVLVEEWDGEDGYTYEKVEFDTTLEEWAEEMIIEVVKTPLFEYVCCCCACKACCMFCKPFCCDWCCFLKATGEKEETTETTVKVPVTELTTSADFNKTTSAPLARTNTRSGLPPRSQTSSAPPKRGPGLPPPRPKTSSGLPTRPKRSPGLPPAPPSSLPRRPIQAHPGLPRPSSLTGPPPPPKTPGTASRV